tara:strand:- start:2426 stop:2941 length:516 start_codon:yes stop_codon:yes gene_type:complete
MKPILRKKIVEAIKKNQKPNFKPIREIDDVPFIDGPVIDPPRACPCGDGTYAPSCCNPTPGPPPVKDKIPSKDVDVYATPAVYDCQQGGYATWYVIDVITDYGYNNPLPSGFYDNDGQPIGDYNQNTYPDVNGCPEAQGLPGIHSDANTLKGKISRVQKMSGKRLARKRRR